MQQFISSPRSRIGPRDTILPQTPAESPATDTTRRSFKSRISGLFGNVATKEKTATIPQVHDKLREELKDSNGKRFWVYGEAADVLAESLLSQEQPTSVGVVAVGEQANKKIKATMDELAQANSGRVVHQHIARPSDKQEKMMSDNPKLKKEIEASVKNQSEISSEVIWDQLADLEDRLERLPNLRVHIGHLRNMTAKQYEELQRLMKKFNVRPKWNKKRVMRLEYEGPAVKPVFIVPKPKKGSKKTIWLSAPVNRPKIEDRDKDVDEEMELWVDNASVEKDELDDDFLDNLPRGLSHRDDRATDEHPFPIDDEEDEALNAEFASSGSTLIGKDSEVNLEALSGIEISVEDSGSDFERSASDFDFSALSPSDSSINALDASLGSSFDDSARIEFGDDSSAEVTALASEPTKVVLTANEAMSTSNPEANGHVSPVLAPEEIVDTESDDDFVRAPSEEISEPASTTLGTTITNENDDAEQTIDGDEAESAREDPEDALSAVLPEDLDGENISVEALLGELFPEDVNRDALGDDNVEHVWNDNVSLVHTGSADSDLLPKFESYIHEHSTTDGAMHETSGPMSQLNDKELQALLALLNGNSTERIQAFFASDAVKDATPFVDSPATTEAFGSSHENGNGHISPTPVAKPTLQLTWNGKVETPEEVMVLPGNGRMSPSPADREAIALVDLMRDTNGAIHHHEEATEAPFQLQLEWNGIVAAPEEMIASNSNGHASLLQVDSQTIALAEALLARGRNGATNHTGIDTPSFLKQLTGNGVRTQEKAGTPAEMKAVYSPPSFPPQITWNGVETEEVTSAEVLSPPSNAVSVVAETTHNDEGNDEGIEALLNRIAQQPGTSVEEGLLPSHSGVVVEAVPKELIAPASADKEVEPPIVDPVGQLENIYEQASQGTIMDVSHALLKAALFNEESYDRRLRAAFKLLQTSNLRYENETDRDRLMLLHGEALEGSKWKLNLDEVLAFSNDGILGLADKEEAQQLESERMKRKLSDKEDPFVIYAPQYMPTKPSVEPKRTGLRRLIRFLVRR